MANKPAVLAQYDREYRKYERFAEEVEHQIKCILEEEGIVCNAVTHRKKDRDSLSKKIDRKQDKYRSLSELTDIAGVRVITYYSSDVDRVSAIVEREFAVDRENSINKQRAMEPDRFGYCSVHYVVSMSEERLKLAECRAYAGMKCEIQIRSVLQHAWAEIEHDLGYKSEIAIPRDIRRSFSRLAGLLEIADKEFQEIREFLTDYRRKKEVEMEQTAEVEAAEPPSGELDAVVLEVILDTDKELQEINRCIQEASGMEVVHNESPYYCESALRELESLGITTSDELWRCIRRHKETAVQLARKMLGDEPLKDGKPVELDRTIGLFYVSYAELLSNECTEEKIIQYYRDNHIGGFSNSVKMRTAARELLQYGREIGVVQ